MAEMTDQSVLSFYTYPSLGEEDWRYAYATAVVRVLEAQMLTQATFVDMANSADFESAAELLSATDYSLPAGAKDISVVEHILLEQRSEVRKLFRDLVLDGKIVELLETREDFANMRLALRRKLTDKPIGTDYSNQGSVPAEQFEELFEQENYTRFPLHMQQAIEQAVLAYYENKDIRQIDYALDSAQARYKIKCALQLKNIFLLELFRMQIDLTNIRTMLRLKFAESEQRNVFLDGGYVEHERLEHALDIGYESVAALFFATPYHSIVESGIHYLSVNQSFLKLESNCQTHLNEFLHLAFGISAGVQPIIAYLLLKENEIRSVRMVLTAKKNSLDTKLILDRLGQ